MKQCRSILYILSMLLFFVVVQSPRTVYAAATEEDILSVEASAPDNGILVSGTTGADVVAVLVEMFDKDNALLTMETWPAEDGSFSGVLAVTVNKCVPYTIYVINFNGFH